MISHQQFLEKEIDMGISLDNPQFIGLAEATVNQLDIDYHTVLDYGAGTGVYSDAFYRAGKEVKVFELWKPHREYMARRLPHLNIIDRPITTDLMLWIEVAEHMTDEEIEKLMYSVKPLHILFSSISTSNPGWDEQWGHINIKQQDEWIEMFSRYGYQLEKDLQYPTPYSKIFKRIS